MLKKTDTSQFRSYLEDSSNLSGGFADGIYFPEDENEIKEALKECITNKTPITISGGTTGTTGGSIPFGGWILGTEKLNRIIDIDKDTAILQPAVTLEALDKELKKSNLLYPPDPTEQKAFIGGTVATNASGSRSFRFGSTRDWIKRLKVILSSGEILDIKRGEKIISNYPLPYISYKTPDLKSSAGYYHKQNMDLIDLFIGAEGTLGIVTEIEVKLIKRFKETFDVIAFFPAEKDAVSFVFEAKRRDALTLEFFDKNSLGLLRPSYSQIPQKAEAAVYFETEISPESDVIYFDNWIRILEANRSNINEDWISMNEKKKEDIIQFRHSMAEHINEEFKKHNTVKFAADIAVPDEKFLEMLNYYNSELNPLSANIFFVKFGHIGQSHLHVNLVPKTQDDIPLAKELILKFVKRGVRLGGTCSAEHGIGKIKHQYLKEMYGEKGISEMVSVKKLFDPACILNQGNIFPKELL